MSSGTVDSTSRRLRARSLRALVTAGVSVVVLSTSAAAPAGASNDVVVSFRDCLINGGTTTVASGVPITIGGLGFAQGTYGLTKDFQLKERTTLTVSNATSVAYDLTREWGAPQQLGRNLWVTRLPDTALSVTLAPGESILATYDITFTQPLLVAYPPVTSSGDNGPYMVTEEGPITCLVTGG